MPSGVRSITQKLLRWPILVVVFTVLTVEFIGYCFVRLCIRVFELSSSLRHRSVKRSLDAATDFVSWVAAARQLDQLEGREGWKRSEESPFYDRMLIKQHMQTMRTYREQGDMQQLMAILRVIFSTYNVGGINNHQLYNETHFGTKFLIHDFLQVVIESTILIRDAHDIALDVRRDFFRHARKWYGHTGLLLSGGAALGYYHIGVIKALLEARCLPRFLSGSSAGSLMCSFLSVRTDAEVMHDLCVPESERFFRACEEPFCTKLTRYLKYGFFFDKDHWRELMRANITKGDTTFLEAYKRTGRVINIAVTGTSKYSPPVLLNYKTTPDVVIWSAVLASSAFPSVLAPIELMVKDPLTNELAAFHLHGRAFVDGTIKGDIPIKQMGKQWNCNFFIVSQVNPHLIPLFFAQSGGTGRPAPHLGSKASSGQRGGFVLAMFEKLLKLEMKKWFQLMADLDVLPEFFGVDWRFIWLQKLTGTVTIVPSAPIWAYFRLISDPNYSRMQHYILEGERATWCKLLRISNHYRLEKLLLDCAHFLDSEKSKQLGIPIPRPKFQHTNQGEIQARLPVAKGSMDMRGETMMATEDTETIDEEGDESKQPMTSSSGGESRSRQSSRKKKQKQRASHQLRRQQREPPASTQQDSTSSPPPSSSSASNSSRSSPHPRVVAASDDEADNEHTSYIPAASPDAPSIAVAADSHTHTTSSSEGESNAAASSSSLPASMSLTAELLQQYVPTWRRGLGLDSDTDIDATDEDEAAERDATPSQHQHQQPQPTSSSSINNNGNNSHHHRRRKSGGKQAGAAQQAETIQ